MEFGFSSTRVILSTVSAEGSVNNVLYPGLDESFPDARRRAIVALSLSATNDFNHACGLAQNDANREILVRKALQKRECEKKMWLGLPIPDPMGAVKADLAMMAYHLEIHNMLTALDKLLEVRSSGCSDPLVRMAVETNLQTFWNVWMKCEKNVSGGGAGGPLACSNPMLDEEVVKVRSFWASYDAHCGSSAK
jgi:hypothetical protein